LQATESVVCSTSFFLNCVQGLRHNSVQWPRAYGASTAYKIENILINPYTDIDRDLFLVYTEHVQNANNKCSVTLEVDYEQR
jgi:hypothetical protein